MKYNFDLPIDRSGTYSLKWECEKNELPMWVADMDFETAPEIKAEIVKRAEHGIFGYSYVPREWYDAYVGWWKLRHDFEIDPEWLVFCTGVVPAISSIVRKLTTPNENVLIQTPVYNIFFNSILNNGCRVLESPLLYKDLRYEIDFEDLERKLSDPQTTLMILCNPHNPVGKIWDAETLSRIGSLCRKYGVVVISDEIHCDLTAPGRSYVPFASVSDDCRENCITCIAPTKAFNLAGTQSAAVMIPNPMLRHKVWRALNTDEVAEPNAFANVAAISAFKYGADWLDELRDYVFENKAEVCAFVSENIPDVKVVPSEATYLVWLDCSELTDNADELVKVIREKIGLWLTEGSEYGDSGRAFIRMNVACPRSRLRDGLQRFKTGTEFFERSSNSAKK